MPFDSMLMSAAVTAGFVVFAAALIWADFQPGCRGSGSLCILKGAGAFETAADVAG